MSNPNPPLSHFQEPIGGVSWSGTGAGAGIRKDAVVKGSSSALLGKMPNSRDEALIATYEVR